MLSLCRGLWLIHHFLFQAKDILTNVNLSIPALTTIGQTLFNKTVDNYSFTNHKPWVISCRGLYINVSWIFSNKTNLDWRTLPITAHNNIIIPTRIKYTVQDCRKLRAHFDHKPNVIVMQGVTLSWFTSKHLSLSPINTRNNVNLPNPMLTNRRYLLYKTVENYTLINRMSCVCKDSWK